MSASATNLFGIPGFTGMRVPLFFISSPFLFPPPIKTFKTTWYLGWVPMQKENEFQNHTIFHKNHLQSWPRNKFSLLCVCTAMIFIWIDVNFAGSNCKKQHYINSYVFIFCFQYQEILLSFQDPSCIVMIFISCLNVYLTGSAELICTSGDSKMCSKLYIQL